MRLLRPVDCRTRSKTFASARLRPCRTNLVLQSRHDVVRLRDLDPPLGHPRRHDRGWRRRKLDGSCWTFLGDHGLRRLRRRLLRLGGLRLRRPSAHPSGQTRHRGDDVRRVHDRGADDEKDDPERRELERVVARRRTHEFARLRSRCRSRRIRGVRVDEGNDECEEENQRQLGQELQAVSSLVCRMRPRLNRLASTHHGE